MNRIVFISLPMSGLDDKDIWENIENARAEYVRRFPKVKDSVAFVDNFGNHPDPIWLVTQGFEGVWHLGYALITLSKCNEAFFYGNWKEARGCLIEHEVCEKYGIPIVEV